MPDPLSETRRRLSQAEPFASPFPVKQRRSGARSARIRTLLRRADVLLPRGLVVTAELLAGGLHTKAPSPATSVLSDICHALKAGKPDTAYGYTSPQLRSTVSSTAFAEELLSTASRATACTYTVDSSSRSPFTLDRRPGPPEGRPGAAVVVVRPGVMCRARR